MNCPYCGYENRNGMSYCQNCGNTLANAYSAGMAAYQSDLQPYGQQYDQGQYRQGQYPQQYAMQQYGQQYNMQPYQPYQQPAATQVASKSSGGALGALRGTVVSPVFIVAASFASLALMLKLVSIFDSNSDILSMLVQILVSASPLIIIVIGMWAALGSLAGGSSSPGTGGWTAIKAGLIIKVVYTCLLLAAFLIVIIAALAAGSLISDIDDLMDSSSGYNDYYDYYGAYDYYDFEGDAPAAQQLAAAREFSSRSAESTIIGITVVLVLLVLAAFILTIIFYAKAIGSINIIKNCVQNGVVNPGVSMFVVVACVFMAVLSLVSVISTIVTDNIYNALAYSEYGVALEYLGLNTDSTWSIVTGLVNLGMYMSAALTLIVYRGKAGTYAARAGRYY